LQEHFPYRMAFIKKDFIIFRVYYMCHVPVFVARYI
jgi:hypothetical protein